jgi:hypothetical protein
MMSFEERSKLGIEKLSEQPPITLDEAKEQVRMLKEKSYTTHLYS